MSPSPRKYPTRDYCPSCVKYGAVKVNGEMRRHRERIGRYVNPGVCPGGKVPPLANGGTS